LKEYSSILSNFVQMYNLIFKYPRTVLKVIFWTILFVVGFFPLNGKAMFRLILKWLGEIIFSSYYLLHLGRGTYFCYSNLEIDIISLVIFCILCFFFLLQTIWKLGNQNSEKTKKQYLYLKWGIHIVFNAFFVYEHLHHPNLTRLVFWILLYWMMELAIHIWHNRKD
jgi:hypothetical protein